MNEEITVFLAFDGFGSDPAIVTDLVCIEPSRANGEGEVLQRAGRDFVAPRASWILRSPLPKSVQPEEQIEALLTLIEPHADGVRKAAELYNGGVLIGLMSDDRLFGFDLTREVVQRLAALSLAVTTDLYLFANELSKKPNSTTAV